MPNRFEDTDFLNRDVTGTTEEDLYLTAEIHERLRSVGVEVVKYEIAIEENGKYLRPEYVNGVLLENTDRSTYREELGKLAIGWHRFFEEAVQDRLPYVLYDSMDMRQYMHGTTKSQPKPTTQLVDIEPSLMRFDEALNDPDGDRAFILDDELSGMREWAEPYWQKAGLHEFAVPELSEEQRQAYIKRTYNLK